MNYGFDMNNKIGYREEKKYDNEWLEKVSKGIDVVQDVGEIFIGICCCDLWLFRYIYFFFY